MNWFVRGDIDGFFGLALDNLVQLLLIYLGLPQLGFYREVLSTDAASYGGSNVGNLGGVRAESEPYMGRPCSARLILPPLAAVYFKLQVE